MFRPIVAGPLRARDAGLASAIVSVVALIRSTNRLATSGKIAAVIAGAVAAINGTLVLTFATGGPGSGNGAVGGAGAIVLGLLAVALGGWACARSRGPVRRTVGRCEFDSSDVNGVEPFGDGGVTPV